VSFIKLVHGAGAREMWKLIEKVIINNVPPEYRKIENGVGLDVLDDGAAIKIGDKYLVFAIDSFTVNPIFFPGGDIGHLAASGVINDLVMMGALPIAFMDTIVVEEGFPIKDLDTIIKSMTKILFENNIALIGGDLKVMPRGSIDKITITGMGIGVAEEVIIDKNIREGDKVIVTAPIAEHGATILATQLGLLDKARDLKSDSKPLTNTVLPVIRKYAKYIHAARDPTRGGLSSTLSEWVYGTDLTIIIDRAKIPIRDHVREFLDALGVDPLSMASEGVAVLAVDPLVADEVVEELHKKGETYSTIIGYVKRLQTK